MAAHLIACEVLGRPLPLKKLVTAAEAKASGVRGGGGVSRSKARWVFFLHAAPVWAEPSYCSRRLTSVFSPFSLLFCVPTYLKGTVHHNPCHSMFITYFISQKSTRPKLCPRLQLHAWTLKHGTGMTNCSSGRCVMEPSILNLTTRGMNHLLLVHLTWFRKG